MLNPLVSVNSNRAPATVLQTLPAPPNREVPPRIADAITVNSAPLSAAALTERRRLANRMPAKPAAALQSTKAAILYRNTLIPERRAASVFPPTAYSRLPVIVHVRTNHTRPANASM